MMKMGIMNFTVHGNNNIFGYITEAEDIHAVLGALCNYKLHNNNYYYFLSN